MAFDVQQIYPIDFNKSAAVGINLPFSYPTAFKPNYTTKEAIKSNLINYFLTNRGERPLNPTFGAGLREFIFEQITSNNLDFLEKRIESNLSTYFPNVSIKELKIDRQPDDNIITVILTYNVINTNIGDTLEIDFI